jgi:hypothetical protein
VYVGFYRTFVRAFNEMLKETEDISKQHAELSGKIMDVVATIERKKVSFPLITVIIMIIIAFMIVFGGSIFSFFLSFFDLF